ncbi:MAG TPA: polymer-forming cytoskeletal protein [Bacillota bacterium]|nr:polymer-forming cytoskeletal protein [Bacillota bacterium]
MFSKKEEIDSTKIDTIIGKETVINGTVEAKGILRIEGKITGQLNTNSDIIIAPTGFVEAEIHCRSISIAGTVQGNVNAKGILEIEPSGKLYGDITVAKLSIGDGAIFQGTCKMQGQNQPLPGKAKQEK